MELRNKRVLVVGLGKSGLAAARFLKERGARVTVSDARPATVIAELPGLLEQGIVVETGGHGIFTFRRQDLIVVSPGVPESVPELQQVRALGMRVIGELELGSQFLRGEVIAVTGSNGKTTTTTLLGEILKASGRPTLVGGNIGRPVVEMVEESACAASPHKWEAGSSASLRNDNQKSKDEEAGFIASLRNDNQKSKGGEAGPSPSAQDDNIEESERPGLAAQNTGVSPLRPAASGRDDTSLSSAVWSVLEVSSFQLETIETFRPHIALVLNITPDHLDRHGTFANYAAAKARITENQTAADFLVLNAEDVEAQKVAGHVFAHGSRSKAQVYWFSPRRQVKQGAFVHGESIFFRASEGGSAEPVMPVSEIPLPGAHNVENVLAAVCAARLAGVEAEVIRNAVAAFQAVEHRLEFVRDLGGVRYYNDSKATNVDATTKALEAFAGGVHLILGGKDKDSDYSTLVPLLERRAKTVITIGSAAEKIEAALAGIASAGVKMERAETMDRAVAFAHRIASEGDIVLLAPACASFDQFQNYEHRGKVFKELVRALS